MQVACSFFQGALDNLPRPWFGTWERLAEILQRVRHPRPGLTGDDAKKSLPALCASTFAPGATRSRDAVTGVHFLLLDFDNAREEPTETRHPSGRIKTRKIRLAEPVSMEAVEAALIHAGIAALGWSTWSAKPDWPKHRWVVPLAAPVPGALWPQAAERALSMLDLGAFRAAIDGPVLHNPAALAFLPGAPDPSSIGFCEVKGHSLSIPSEGLEAVRMPRRELPAWEAERKAARDGEQWWKAYRTGGLPVEFKGLNLVPMLERLGCKLGPERPWQDGAKRRCTCPWAQEHSGGVDDDSAVIFYGPTRWPEFRCQHSGHLGQGLRELIEHAWGRP